MDFTDGGVVDGGVWGGGAEVGVEVAVGGGEVGVPVFFFLV